MDTLAADVNRTGIHSLDVPDSFDTDGAFSVELRNHGEATHVHLHLDDSLSRVAELEAGNHYVDARSTRPVRVHVDGVTEPVRGKLKIVTAYGAETHYVDVTLGPPKKQPVDVDPDLSKPGAGARKGSKRSARTSGGRLEDVDLSSAVSALPVVVLGALAVVFALAAVLSGGRTNIGLAVLAVVAAVVAAGYIVLQ